MADLWAMYDLYIVAGVGLGLAKPELDIVEVAEASLVKPELDVIEAAGAGFRLLCSRSY